MTTANTGCARNQGTTQFCAEAVEAHKELREARAEIEQLALNMAMISTIACKQELDWYPTQQPWERAALRDVVNLIRTLEECRAEIERLKTELAKLKEAT